MLIVSQEELTRRHEDAKRGLTDQFNSQLERILNENQHKELYWVLGKVRFPAEFQGKVGRVFLEPSDTKPPVVRDAFLYEVDNRRGVKSLLWVMHPNDDLSLPTLGKTLRVS